MVCKDGDGEEDGEEDGDGYEDGEITCTTN